MKRLTKKQRLFYDFQGSCAYCGIEIEFSESQMDHITPKGRGGSSRYENLALACAPCNIFKSDLEIQRFYEKAINRRKAALDEWKYWDRVASTLEASGYKLEVCE